MNPRAEIKPRVNCVTQHVALLNQEIGLFRVARLSQAKREGAYAVA
jgi:hypothetical protein